MPDAPMQSLAKAIKQHGLVRFLDHFEALCPADHLKDLVVDKVGPGRWIEAGGRKVVNFGSDSFLGLDQDPRVSEALVSGLARWGSHNGASRAFASVRSNIEAEEKLARWLGTESVLIYPSVTLANMGAIPGLVARGDLLAVDEHAHNSIQEGAKIAQANGAKVVRFGHSSPGALEAALAGARPYRNAVVALDGVYSMTGALPPLAEINRVALEHNAVLYVDDAHGTGVLGKNGRGTVLEALGSYENAFVVGSLSKGFSCAGGFIGCTRDFQRLLKMRSNTYIFGGPVTPPYLEAVCAVVDILMSPDYVVLRRRLDANIACLTRGLKRLGLAVLGSALPIVSVLIGDEQDTLTAGRLLFDRGFYVQSVVFPAVPYHAGILRIQVNANHEPAHVDGLLEAMHSLRSHVALPGPEAVPHAA